MLFKSFATVLFALSRLVAGDLWIDSFEQDPTLPAKAAGAPVGSSVAGPMSYSNLGYYKGSQLPVFQINGGGWIGGSSSSTTPGWKLKTGGRFKQVSIDYACIAPGTLSLQVAIPCTITATGKKAGGTTVQHVLNFDAAAIQQQTFASSDFPASFADVTEITFKTVALLALNPLAIPQFDYNVYETL